MGLVFNGTKDISENTLVREIVQEIRENRKFFIYLARLFADYKKNDSSLISEIHVQIDNILNSPRLKYSSIKKTFLSKTLKAIYDETEKKFHVIRAQILEDTVFYLGPFSGITRKECFIEPVIKDYQTSGEEKVVGDSDIKCDCVYFLDEGNPLEFVECKADIANVIPKTLPFEKAKRDHQRKVLYLDNAFNYLSANYSPPIIYFACYNLNYGIMLNNLHNNWGFKNMNFINAEEIINGKKRRA